MRKVKPKAVSTDKGKDLAMAFVRPFRKHSVHCKFADEGTEQKHKYPRKNGEIIGTFERGIKKSQGGKIIGFVQHGRKLYQTEQKRAFADMVGCKKQESTDAKPCPHGRFFNQGHNNARNQHTRAETRENAKVNLCIVYTHFRHNHCRDKRDQPARQKNNHSSFKHIA